MTEGEGIRIGSIPLVNDGHIQRGGGVDDGVSLMIIGDRINVPALGGSVALERGTASNPT